MPEAHDKQNAIDAAARQFRRQRDISNSTLDSLGDGIITINAAGIIELVNKQAELLTGYTRDDLAGKSIEILVPDEFQVGHQGLRTGYQSNPTSRIMGQNRDVRLRRKDGETTPMIIRLSTFPVEGEGIFSSAQFHVKEDVQIEKDTETQ